MPEPIDLTTLSLSPMDLMWLASVTQLIAIAVLLWLHWQVRRDMADAINDANHETETGFTFLRESLATYKLEADRAYATHRRVSAIERRLRDLDGRLEDLDLHPRVNGHDLRRAAGGGA